MNTLLPLSLNRLRVAVAVLAFSVVSAVSAHNGEDHSDMDHSGMDRSKMEMPAQKKPADPHAGHAMSKPSVDNQESMDHSATDHGKPKPSNQPREPIPGITPADRAAAFPENLHGHAAHDNHVQSFVLFNRLETFDADVGTGLAWEGQGWVGTDLNRMWLRAEGERINGVTESSDLELLYGRSVSRWWDVVAGIRHDIQPGESQDFAAIGVMGLAPYQFEIEATFYIGESSQTAARLEAEYDLLLTNRLILQPLVELNLYGKTDAQRGIGSGLSSTEAGLRLRYEIRREFAPYIGINWEKSFDDTADLVRARGEPIDDSQFVFGLRTWF